MTTEQKQRLENALKKAGIGLGLVQSYEGLDETALETVIKGLEAASPQQLNMEDVVKSGAFTDFIKAGGFDKMLSLNKDAQSQYDSKMAKGFNTRLQNWLEQNGEGTRKPGGGTAAGAAVEMPADTPDWAKAIIQSNQELTKKVQTLEAQKASGDKMGEAKSLMAKSKLPEPLREMWLSRINVNSETPLADQVTALEKEHELITGATSEDGAGAGAGAGAYQFQQGKKTDGALSANDKAALEAFAATAKI